MAKKTIFYLLGIILLISCSTISAEIQMNVGEPQIISVGQDITPGEVILTIGIKNIGDSEGGFRLFVETGNNFRLDNDWYGTLESGQEKFIELKLLGDSEFYGEENYKTILEETLSKEQDTYEDSFLITQKTIEDKGVKDFGISGIEHNFNTKPFSQLFIIYIIIPLIILIGIVIYFKVLKSKHKS